MLINLILIACGFALLIVGANALVDGACGIARRLGLPDRVTGLTVVAVGTAAPELVVGITSALEGHADMAFGNVAGSCLANLLLILGLSATITPLALGRRTVRFEIPASLAAIGALVAFANTGGALTALEGAVLLAGFIAFMACTVRAGLREGAASAESGLAAAADAESGGEAAPAAAEAAAAADDGLDALGRIKAVAGALAAHPLGAALFIAGGIALLKVGADLVIAHSVAVASAVGISERVIGITVIALGTCLPELITSVVAAFRGNTDLAVGNVVGSNVTNVLLVMGAPALVATVPYGASYNLDFGLLALFTAVLAGFARTGARGRMSRAGGVVFVVLYAAYLGLALIV